MEISNNMLFVFSCRKAANIAFQIKNKVESFDIYFLQWNIFS